VYNDEWMAKNGFLDGKRSDESPKLIKEIREQIVRNKK
jgi:hypothetical protein